MAVGKKTLTIETGTFSFFFFYCALHIQRKEIKIVGRVLNAIASRCEGDLCLFWKGVAHQLSSFLTYKLAKESRFTQ